MQINSDLHIHSKYSMATSRNMELSVIAGEARKKGVHLVGSGDCLHPEWRRELKRLDCEGDLLVLGDTYFIPTVEVEDINRVHHLLLVPSLSKADELYEHFEAYSPNIDDDGRPSVNFTGEEIAEVARDSESLIGPAHVFTPWTAMYAYHDSLSECYSDLTGYISFVELGLSADTAYADRISELHRLTFLTNSDAHSPWPNKLAREFTRFEVEAISFEDVKKAILREGGRCPTLNIGFFPEEGKYNESACIRCFKHYTLREAMEMNWRCGCGGRIKKGVRDRVEELADTTTHPDNRPPYLHVLPLSEIIAMALGHSSPNTKTVQTTWNKLIKAFGSEVKVLVDAKIESIDFVDERIVEAIKAFRENRVTLRPGGGGKYGQIELPTTTEKSTGQASLS
ncbi:MAG TPA: TIGR00375 family protein, partial [Candidatus Methanoperedenaceae archaeon]|nr:TIGR00375 family protein [Candidatus Methanoperedenaceae archaeon]